MRFQFLKFVLIGGLCAGLGLVVMWMLTGLLGIHYLISTTVVFFAVNPIGYLLNKKFTFEHTSLHFVLQLFRYYAVTAGTLLFTLILSALLVDGIGLHYLTTNALIAIGMVVFNFAGHLRWTFQSIVPPRYRGDR